MLKLILAPYPLIISNGIILRYSLVIGTFIFLFLFVFQPFGIANIAPKKTLIISGYGFITFFLTWFYLSLRKLLFKDSTWITLYQISFYIVLLASIALANSFYTSIHNSQLNTSHFDFMLYTISIAVIPIIFISFTHQKYLSDKYIQESKQINNSLNKSNPISDSDAQEIEFSPKITILYGLNQDSILFIESEKNYLIVYVLKQKESVAVKIRGTIKDILAELNPLHFKRTHRAFVVNLKYIENTSGNALGLKLKLKGIDVEVPVSKNFIKDFKEQLRK